MKQIKNIFQRPRVYLFKNKEGRVLYVGKTKKIKKKTSTISSFRFFKNKKLLLAAKDFEIIEIKNKVETIFKESDLIKNFTFLLINF
jgi:excinuclease ABC subunit C